MSQTKASHGAALVAACVRAACMAKAPRRTCAAVAAAAVSAALRPDNAAVAPPSPVPEHSACPSAGDAQGDDELVQQLRQRRAERRRAKRQRRQAAKAAGTVVAQAQGKDGKVMTADLCGKTVEAADVTPRRAPPPTSRDPTGDTPPCKRVALGSQNGDDGGVEGDNLAAAVSLEPMASSSTSDALDMSATTTGNVMYAEHPDRSMHTWYETVLNTGVAHFADGSTKPVSRSLIGSPDRFSDAWMTTKSADGSASWIILPVGRQVMGESSSLLTYFVVPFSK